MRYCQQNSSRGEDFYPVNLTWHDPCLTGIKTSPLQRRNKVDCCGREHVMHIG